MEGVLWVAVGLVVFAILSIAWMWWTDAFSRFPPARYWPGEPLHTEP
jgi:hypothetical protein